LKSNSLISVWRLVALLIFCAAICARADWRDDLTAPTPGDFPALRPVSLSYECGWSGLTAGRVDARFYRDGDGICVLDATAATSGLARALWKLDATHEARGDLHLLKPVSVRQKESYHAQDVTTKLDFDVSGVEHFRESSTDKKPAKSRHYDFPNLYDLQMALLFVRSQKLNDGDVYHIVVFPGSAAYLATVTVLGHEKIHVKAGDYPSIKVDLKLAKITGDMTLAPHGKFKRATGWISDDANRLPLKMDAQIFVGSVWVELVKSSP
jgi:hypothetical protein